ncbi:transcriptional regulator [Brooklawnia cerclae]
MTGRMLDARLGFRAYFDNMVVVNIKASTDSAPRAARVLELLLARGPLTARELADALNMTTAGVRRHLDTLLESGDIEARDQEGPHDRGRPPKVFVLTPTGRETFGQAYDELAISALAELIDLAGPGAIDRLAQKRLSDVTDDYRARRTADPDGNPVEALAEALSAGGHFASVPDDGELYQHHCPVAEVAATYPELCEAETRIFAKLLGTSISRSATIAQGDAACRTHLGGSTLLPAPVIRSADREVNA